MLGYSFGYTVACLLALFAKKCLSFPYGDDENGIGGRVGKAESQVISYEEYVIEHEISMEQARNAAASIDLKSVKIPPGCQTCTPAEINYCEGSDFVNDHCCCDKRYHEMLSYIPHTCYRGTRLSKPVAGDCGVYEKLRKCCCHLHELKRWKSGSADSISSQFTKSLVLILLIFQIALFYRIHFMFTP